jgi:hypothetical protein
MTTVFWDVEPCRSCVNQRFGETYRLRLQGRKERNQREQVAANIVTRIRVCDYPDHTTSTGKMAHELERIRKETALS